MNGPVIFMAKGTLVQHRLRYINLVTKYGFTEQYCVIPKKSAYMDDKTGEKLVKVVAPGIRNSKASNVAGVLTILLSIYLTIYSCISKLSADDM